MSRRAGPARAHAGDAAANHELLDERIDDRVRQRARHYQERDVLDESQRSKCHWQALGDEGLAKLYEKTAPAVRATGADTRSYLSLYARPPRP